MSKIKELRKMRDYSGSRLRRAKILYIKLSMHSIECGSVKHLYDLALRMRELGFYSQLTHENDIAMSIICHMWKLTLPKKRMPRDIYIDRWTKGGPLHIIGERFKEHKKALIYG